METIIVEISVAGRDHSVLGEKVPYLDLDELDFSAVTGKGTLDRADVLAFTVDNMGAVVVDHDISSTARSMER
jgi:hypothetical protein